MNVISHAALSWIGDYKIFSIYVEINETFAWKPFYMVSKIQVSVYVLRSCLRSWLEQDMSCPTCRMSVNMSGSQTRNEQEGASLSVSLGPAAVGNLNRAPISYQSHLFHFDGTDNNCFTH